MVKTSNPHLSSLLAPHSGYKTLKPARNRFTSVCSNVTSRVFQSKFQNFRFRMSFIFKTFQTVAGISMLRQFHRFFLSSISGGFLPFGRTVARCVDSWRLYPEDKKVTYDFCCVTLVSENVTKTFNIDNYSLTYIISVGYVYYYDWLIAKLTFIVY